MKQTDESRQCLVRIARTEDRLRTIVKTIADYNTRLRKVERQLAK